MTEEGRQRGWHRAVLVGAAVLAAAALLAPVGSARRSVTPRVGDYWGEYRGATVLFQVVRVRGALKVHNPALAGPKGDLNHPSPQCEALYDIFPSASTDPIRGGAFRAAQWMVGRFRSSTSASGTVDEGRHGVKCTDHWSASHVSRRLVRSGRWTGTTSFGTLTFHVIDGGRSIYQGGGSGGIPGCATPGFAGMLISPSGEVFTTEGTTNSGFDYVIKGRFTSATSANGTFILCGHQGTWSARHV